MIKKIMLDFCEIEFHDRYVVLTFETEILLDLSKAKILRNKFTSFYGSQDFVLITNRKSPHQVATEVYKQGQLKNMKGLAIVSKEKTERDKAMMEQSLFDKSFVFFDTLEEAISWAETYFSK